MTVDMLGLITQIGAVAVLFLWLAALMRGDIRTRQELERAQAEITRADQRLKDLTAAHELVVVTHEREKDLLRKEVHDWQERSWAILNEFGKPAVEVLKERRSS